MSQPATDDPANTDQRRLTLEGILTSPAAFGLTSATPVKRAICRIADGLPLGDLAGDAEVRAALGGTTDTPTELPAEVYVLRSRYSLRALVTRARGAVARRR